MAIKQALAVKTMEAAAGGKVVSASLSEVTNGWVALVIKAADKKLVCVTQSALCGRIMPETCCPI